MSFLIENLLKPDTVHRVKPDNARSCCHCHGCSIEGYRSKLYDYNTDEADEKQPLNISKKRRVLFTSEQIHELEKVFKCKQYLSIGERDELSKKIHLSATQVKIWFQNHRYKTKKEMKEIRKHYELSFHSPPRFHSPSITRRKYKRQDLHPGDHYYQPIRSINNRLYNEML